MPGGQNAGTFRSSGVSGLGSATSPVNALNKNLLTTDKLVSNLVKNSKEFHKYFTEVAKGVVPGTMGGMGAKSATPSMGVVASVMTGAVVGRALYNALPDVQQAVSQRMAAQQVASFSGRGYTPASVISRANAANVGGFTSAQGMSEAAATFMGMGYSFGSRTVGANLRQVGGMSVISGLANEQVAAGISSINAMGFVRAGILARNPDGSLKPINQIADQVFRRMWGGRVPTPEQAAAVFRPSARAYRNLQMMTGGDQNLMRMLQSAVVMQAQNKGKRLDTSNPKKMMDLMGYSGTSPERRQFQLATSQASQLQATGAAQTEGYSAALDAASRLTDGFTALYNATKPLADNFSRMQGFFSTFRNTGNVGASAANLVGSVVSGGMQLGSNYLAYRAIKSFMAARAAGAAGAGAAGAAGAGAAGAAGAGAAGAASTAGTTASTVGLMALLKKYGSKGLSLLKGPLGKVAGTLLAPLTLWDTFKTGKMDENWNWRHFGQAIGSGALAGSPFGGWIGAAAGGIINGLNYGLGHAMGGGHPDMSSMSVGGGYGGDAPPSSNTTVSPIAGGKVTTPYGAKPKDGSYWTWKGYHTGVDYAVKEGTPVRATKDGKVTGDNPGSSYGNTVMIDHGRLQTLYAHLSSKKVRPGQKVKAGQLIGYSGKTGSGAKGPHLHFEVRQGKGNPINPVGWLRGAVSGAFDFVTNIFGKAKSGIASGIGNALNFTTQTISQLFGLSNEGGSIWSSFLNQNQSTEKGTDLPGHSTVDGKAYIAKPELLKLLHDVGFRGNGLATAYAVAMAESHGRPKAHNTDRSTGDNSYGIFQINMLGKLEKERNAKFRQYVKGYNSKNDLFNPVINARAAYYMTHHGENWNSWTTYTSNKYKSLVPSQKELSKILNGAPMGGGQPDTVTPASVVSAHGGDRPSSSQSNITINATFNVKANGTSPAEVKSFTHKVVKLLEDEIRESKIGKY